MKRIDWFVATKLILQALVLVVTCWVFISTVTGCAAGRIQKPNVTIQGIAIGDARLASCVHGSASEAQIDGECAELTGGSVSSVFGALGSIVGSLAASGVF